MTKEYLPISFELNSIIYEYEGMRVMVDSDLARLYGVTTKRLVQAMKRNSNRFPSDFVFKISTTALDKRVLVENEGRGGRAGDIYLFSEQGIAMLSSVLRSERAVRANIEIMRAFVRAREFFMSQQELRYKLEDLEKRFDKNFKIVFDALREVITVHEKTTEIGFKTEEN